jgi:hypothetical protein
MSGFPAWRYYRDGRAVIVKSQEELDALEPGWADSSVGPWADGFQGEPPWKPGKGPFAPDYMSEHHGAYPPSVPEGIYAAQPVCCNGWARNEGEVFRHEGTLEEERLLLKGDVRPVPPGRRFKHEPTYRWFLDESTRDAYALRYEAGDVSGFVVDGGGPGKDTAVAAQDPATPRSRPGRPADAEWRAWTLPDLVTILKDGLHKAQHNLPHKKRLTFEDVAAATGYAPRDLRRSMYSYGHTWKTIRPLLHD